MAPVFDVERQGHPDHPTGGARLTLAACESQLCVQKPGFSEKAGLRWRASFELILPGFLLNF